MRKNIVSKNKSRDDGNVEIRDKDFIQTRIV